MATNLGRVCWRWLLFALAGLIDLPPASAAEASPEWAYTAEFLASDAEAYRDG
jgi:hypothetical protein